MLNVTISSNKEITNSASLEIAVEIKFNCSSIYLKLESVVQPRTFMIMFCYQKAYSSNFSEKYAFSMWSDAEDTLNEDGSSNFKSLRVVILMSWLFMLLALLVRILAEQLHSTCMQDASPLF